MDLKEKNGIRYLEYELGAYGAVFLTRTGGYSASPYDSMNLSKDTSDDENMVDKNHGKLYNEFGLEEEKLVRLDQVHGNDLLVINKSREGNMMTGVYDAAVTDDESLALSVMTADCVPIMLSDSVNGVCAAVHAGWRGTAMRIANKAVGMMEREFLCDPKSIKAVIGPSIGICCYDVGVDTLDRLKASVDNASSAGSYRIVDGKNYVDLRGFNSSQLIESGLNSENIICTEYCTSCSDDLFFSYRRENITGRQLSFIRKL